MRQGHATGEPDIRPFRATFRDRAAEQAYLAFREQDNVRSCTVALLFGGLAYLFGGVTDASIFSSVPEHLLTVRALRAVGVLLCLGGAALVWRIGKNAAVNVVAAIAMVGTLLTYTGIAYLEEAFVGPSDFRLVFFLFSLLAFIFFPIPVTQSAGMFGAMMLNVVLMFVQLGKTEWVIVARTIVLMTTSAIAGASFSITSHRGRRREYWLRRRVEETVDQLRLEAAERRAVETELQQHKQNLEQRVMAQAEELHQAERRLVASQRMEAIGQLAGGLAHDFNNLLLVIIGNAELTLMSEALSAEIGSSQREILGAAERAAALSRDLLAFGRRQIMEFHPIDLTTVVEEMVSILLAAVGAKVEVRFVPPANVPTIRGARGPLEQVILNLVLNARDATSPGGKITIEIASADVDAAMAQIHADAAPGHYARLSVADTGSGIEASHLDRIFEPFFSTKPEGSGTGLGLSVVHGIVRQHSGFIVVSSELGRGSTFEVYLPAANEPAQAPVKRATPVPAFGGEELILVVDDEAPVLKLATLILEKAGYAVLTADDAEKAIETFRVHASDIALIVSDLVMPRISGQELMTKIHEMDPDVPFLFSSGYADGGIHKKLFPTQGITLLQKPYGPADLVGAVRKLLDERRR